MKKRMLAGCAAAVVVGGLVVVGIPATAATAPVGPRLESIGALKFGPDGILFVGDSRGASIYALELGGLTRAGSEFTAVRDLDGKIAAMLGTSPHDIFIKDMAVDQTTGNAYLSIMRGNGEGAEPVLMRVSADGAVHHVALEGVHYTQLDLADAPDAAPTARRNPRSYTITDMELLDGELFIAGLSNEEFSSVLRRAPFPFHGDAIATGLEIYHGAHGQYETNAPVYTFLPIELGGKPHVLAGYLCTPLVAFSVDELKSSDKLRGKTIAEMGFGNVPIDMLAIEQEGEQFVVMTNTRRGTMKMKLDDIHQAFARDGIVEPVGPRVGVDYLSAPLGHVVQIDEYDAENVLILERNAENGSLSLSMRGKEWI